MNELLSARIPNDVGEVLLFGAVLFLVGMLGVIAGTATERSRTRRDLQDVFTDPDLPKTIFLARWFADPPPGSQALDVNKLWDENEDLRDESNAAARAVYDRVTTELGL